jgi:pyruvate ferredoxin oxidoreductase gamma subunit
MICSIAFTSVQKTGNRQKSQKELDFTKLTNILVDDRTLNTTFLFINHVKLLGIFLRELRIHGRGGQGSVTAAELIAVAAFKSGIYSQAFPAFGVERRGAPVQAFVRFSDKKIRLRSQVYQPDYIIVQDSTLIKDVDVMAGIKEGGIAIFNTEKEIDVKVPNGVTMITLDATSIALEVLGLPITNTSLMGAFAGATGEIEFLALEEALRERFPGALADKNIEAARRAYTLVKGGA